MVYLNKHKADNYISYMLKPIIKKYLNFEMMMIYIVVALQIFVFIKIMSSFQHHGADEHNIGRKIVEDIKKEIAISPHQHILFSLGNESITINVYGVIDEGIQNRIKDAALKSLAATENQRMKAKMFFYPQREFIERTQEGSRSDTLIKEKAIRSVQLN